MHCTCKIHLPNGARVSDFIVFTQRLETKGWYHTNECSQLWSSIKIIQGNCKVSQCWTLNTKTKHLAEEYGQESISRSLCRRFCYTVKVKSYHHRQYLYLLKDVFYRTVQSILNHQQRACYDLHKSLKNVSDLKLSSPLNPCSDVMGHQGLYYILIRKLAEATQHSMIPNSWLLQ